MRGLENDIELRFFRKVPLLSYRNIGGRKTTLIFENPQKIHKLVGFHGSKRKKSACLFSEADAHFLYSFLPQQPDQQLIDILGGLAACYQLVPKGQQGRCQQPSLAGA